jgi:hypothetical protein
MPSMLKRSTWRIPPFSTSDVLEGDGAAVRSAVAMLTAATRVSEREVIVRARSGTLILLLCGDETADEHRSPCRHRLRSSSKYNATGL